MEVFSLIAGLINVKSMVCVIIFIVDVRYFMQCCNAIIKNIEGYWI